MSSPAYRSAGRGDYRCSFASTNRRIAILVAYIDHGADAYQRR